MVAAGKFRRKLLYFISYAWYPDTISPDTGIKVMKPTAPQPLRHL
jgi:hypothetical protein